MINNHKINSMITLVKIISSETNFLNLPFFTTSLRSTEINAGYLTSAITKRFNSILVNLQKKEMKELLAMRLSMFFDIKKDHEEIYKSVGLNPRLINSIASNVITKQYALNMLDFNIYNKSIYEKNKHQIVPFYILKETLFTSEDYRDQIELFLDIRSPYLSQDNDALQNNLMKEYQVISEYTQQLSVIYNAVISFFDKQFEKFKQPLLV